MYSGANGHEAVDLMNPAKKTYSVLMADDSEDDRFFLRRAMDDCERFTPVAEVQDGAEAIAYLKGEGEFADRSRFADAGFIARWI